MQEYGVQIACQYTGEAELNEVDVFGSEQWRVGGKAVGVVEENGRVVAVQAPEFAEVVGCFEDGKGELEGACDPRCCHI